MTQRTYSYKGYSPYGAAQQLFIDGYLDDTFMGNATEQLIKEQRAKFEIIDEENAVLKISMLNGNEEEVDYVRR